MTLNYRPIAPDNLDQIVNRLEELAVSTVLPWKFDAKKKRFYVEQNGKQLPISFEEGDAETEIVLAIANHLPLLLAALYNRFYFMTGDENGRRKVQKTSETVQGRRR